MDESGENIAKVAEFIASKAADRGRELVRRGMENLAREKKP
jgi:hypothetical protein